MKKLLLAFVGLLSSLCLTLAFSGCSDDSPSTASYSGPGSQWSVSLSGNTFTITRAPSVGAAVELTVNGTYETLSSGFLKLEVTSATGTDAPNVGDQAYALNIPGFVFMLKPMTNDGEIIPMIVSGVCPTTQMDFNWMVTSHEASGQGSDLSTNRDLVGTASFNGSDTMTLPSKYDLQGTSLSVAGDPAMTGSCSSGIIDLPSANASLWLSQSGGALVQIVNSGRDSVIVAMPQSTLSSVSDLDGEYFGILFNEAVDENSQSETAPVYMTVSGGSGTAGEYTNVDNGTKDTVNVASFSFTANSPANGFVSGTLTSGSDTTPMTCQVTTNVNSSGRNLMFCVGVDPDNYTNGAKDQLYTVILISQ